MSLGGEEVELGYPKFNYVKLYLHFQSVLLE